MSLNLHIRINLAVILATLAAEGFSFIWYSDTLPWASSRDRHFLPALVAEFALAVMIQSIISTHWAVRKTQDALTLAIQITLVYAALQAPHYIAGPTYLVPFAFNVLHKVLLIFIITAVLYLVRKSGY